MEWDLLVTLALAAFLTVNTATYFRPKPKPGVNEVGDEKPMPKKNYKRQKKRKRKDKGYPLQTFSQDCSSACAPLTRGKKDLYSPF